VTVVLLAPLFAACLLVVINLFATSWLDDDFRAFLTVFGTTVLVVTLVLRRQQAPLRSSLGYALAAGAWVACCALGLSVLLSGIN
jgi:hypothetical protein